MSGDGDIVIVDYVDLIAEEEESKGGGGRRPSVDLTSQLYAAFGGPNSKGLLAIRGVPDFVEARDAFLPLAHPLARLPPDYLDSHLTDPSSLYNAGWSHGREKLKAHGPPDLSKGSFYFNPLTDEPGTPEERARHPASYPRNVWPDDGRMPGFEEGGKRLGRIMHGAVVALARHIDTYAAQRAREEEGREYPRTLLHDAMRRTDKAKGRLLYYFPLDGDDISGGDAEEDEPQAPAEDSWIGWHNDSGFLTALAGDLYIDHDTGRRLNPSEVDPEAGLYVVDRTGGTVKVDMPPDCLAVQIGECTQIVTGGAVVATPHCVRGARSKGVARIACPCFIDAPPSFPLRSPGGGGGGGRERVLSVGLGKDRVPPLDDRWTEEGVPFGDFLAETFKRYYEWGDDGDDNGEREEKR